MMSEKLSRTELAKAVKEYIVYQKLATGHVIAMAETECCDVLTVNYKMDATEWEVKVDRQDLRSELKIIEEVLRRREDDPYIVKEFVGSKSRKYGRHMEMLGELKWKSMVKNYYNIVVPEELVDVALETVKKTKKYGLYVFSTRYATADNPNIHGLNCLVKPKRIHHGSSVNFYRLATRLCSRLHFPNSHVNK